MLTSKYLLFLDDLRRLLPEYEITIPSVVSFGGEYISHDLENALSLTQKHYTNRRRRSIAPDALVITLLDNNRVPKFNTTIDMRNDMYYGENDTNLTSGSSNISAESEGHFSDHQSVQNPIFHHRRYVHFNISAFGSSLQLKVEMKAKLIAPGAKSVYFTAGGHRIEKDLTLDCYYFGKIAHHSRSKVAISNCNGLVSTNNIFLHINLKFLGS